MSELSGTIEAKRTERWVRTAGIGTIVGGGAVLVGSILDNVTNVTSTPATPEYVFTWSMLAVGAFLLLAGTAAAYARYGDAYGRLGLVGSLVAGLGFLSMTVGGVWNALYTGPVSDALPGGGFAFGGLLLAALGSLVLGLALRRSGVAGRAALFMIAAPVVLVATFVVGEALTALSGFDVMWLLFLTTFALGWVAFGDAVRYRANSAVDEPVAPVA